MFATDSIRLHCLRKKKMRENTQRIIRSNTKAKVNIAKIAQNEVELG